MNTLLYRIHTEHKGDIPTIAGQFFPGFTLLTGVGYFNGFKEATAVLEVYGTEDDRPDIHGLAKAIATINEQDEVLVVELGKDGPSVTMVGAVKPRTTEQLGEALVEAANVIPFPKAA